MPGFKRYDIVSVPFPYTDRAALERRPALVSSNRSLESRHGLLWVLMITAAENRSWHSYVPIPDHFATGLPILSIVRPTKIATVETRRARKCGRVPAATAAAVAEALNAIVS
jgi:mRNA interferase MazF